jgi:phosphoribosylanthranilate isomerase
MRPRTRIKICGITNLPDARLAVELGADALGFNFFAKSKRYISPDDARYIIDQISPLVTSVAVVVNETVEHVQRLLLLSGCQVAQLHGEETPTYMKKLDRPTIKTVSVATFDDLEKMGQYKNARAFLLDTKVAGEYGGTGISFDWQIAGLAHEYGRPVILAGGLTPANVTEAVNIATPHAVDVCSGIESEPGKKDHELMRRFFDAIQGC